MKSLLSVLILFSIAGCIPNTKYSTTDEYAIGLRWFERGSFKEAIRYWEPLVKKEDCDAEYRMGLMYFAALGTTQSFEKAHVLWIKAANGNQQRAQWALGDLYLQDESLVFHHCTKTPTCNIKKDIKEALFWYKLFEKSAKYSNEKKIIKYVVPKVEAQLSISEINAIKERAEKWKPTPKDCGARNMW